MKDAGMELTGRMERELSRRARAIAAPPTVGVGPAEGEAEAEFLMRMPRHPQAGGVPFVHQVEPRFDGQVLHRTAANRSRRTHVSDHLEALRPS